MAGAITGIIGGIQSRNAAKNAANDQVNAANQAAGGYESVVNGVNPQIGAAATAAGAGVQAAADSAADGVLGAAGSAGAGVTSAAADANALLDPYVSGGSEAFSSIRGMIAPDGELNHQFSEADMLADPGYEFRAHEQQKALERAAAARGGVSGGGHLKALTRYMGALASQEYGSAFDRFEKSRQGKFSNLLQIVGLGSDAAARSGANTIGAARYSGDVGFEGERTAGGYRTNAATYTGNAGMRSAELQGANQLEAGRLRHDATIGAGNARAAGHIGAANAWNSTLGAIGKGVDGALAGGFSGGSGFSLRGMARGY